MRTTIMLAELHPENDSLQIDAKKANKYFAPVESGPFSPQGIPSAESLNTLNDKRKLTPMDTTPESQSFRVSKSGSARYVRFKGEIGFTFLDSLTDLESIPLKDRTLAFLQLNTNEDFRSALRNTVKLYPKPLEGNYPQQLLGRYRAVVTESQLQELLSRGIAVVNESQYINLIHSPDYHPLDSSHVDSASEESEPKF